MLGFGRRSRKLKVDFPMARAAIDEFFSTPPNKVRYAVVVGITTNDDTITLDEKCHTIAIHEYADDAFRESLLYRRASVTPYVGHQQTHSPMLDYEAERMARVQERYKTEVPDPHGTRIATKVERERFQTLKPTRDVTPNWRYDSPPNTEEY